MATQYIGLTTPAGWTTVLARGEQPWSVEGFWKNLLVRVSPAPGAGVSLDYALLINGVASALGGTIAGAFETSFRDITNQPAVSPGDRLALELVKTGGGALDLITQISAEFVSETTATGYGTGYGFQALNAPDTGAVNYAPLLGYTTEDVNIWTPDLYLAKNIVSSDGLFERIDVLLETSPGGGTWTFVLMKNDIVQAASQFAVTGGSTSGSQSFSIGAAQGDTVAMRCTPSGGPASSRIGVSCRFKATTPGESLLACTAAGAGLMSEALVEYARPQANATWDEDETLAHVRGGITPFGLRNFFVQRTAETTIGAHGFQVRRNSATPPNGPAVTFTGLGGSDLRRRVTVLEGDVWNIRQEVELEP